MGKIIINIIKREYININNIILYFENQYQFYILLLYLIIQNYFLYSIINYFLYSIIISNNSKLFFIFYYYII